MRGRGGDSSVWQETAAWAPGCHAPFQAWACLAWLLGLLPQGLASGWFLAVEFISFALVVITVWSCLAQRADSTWLLTLLSVPLPIFPSCLGCLSNERETEAQVHWASEGLGKRHSGNFLVLVSASHPTPISIYLKVHPGGGRAA